MLTIIILLLWAFKKITTKTMVILLAVTWTATLAFLWYAKSKIDAQSSDYSLPANAP